MYKIETTKLNKTFRAFNACCELVVSTKHYWHASCDVFILNFSTLATTVCGATDSEDVIMMLDLTFDMLRVPKLLSFLIRLCFDAAVDGAQHYGTVTSNKSDNFDIEKWIL